MKVTSNLTLLLRAKQKKRTYSLEFLMAPVASFNVLVVGQEKELEKFLPHVQAAKKYVSPMRIQSENRSVQACQLAQVRWEALEKAEGPEFLN